MSCHISFYVVTFSHVHMENIWSVNDHVLRCFGQTSRRTLETQGLKNHSLETSSLGGGVWRHSPPVCVWAVIPHAFYIQVSSTSSP